MNKIIYIACIIFTLMLLQNCQSRALSRYTGKALNLELPEDFDQILSANVDQPTN